MACTEYPCIPSVTCTYDSQLTLAPFNFSQLLLTHGHNVNCNIFLKRKAFASVSLFLYGFYLRIHWIALYGVDRTVVGLVGRHYFLNTVPFPYQRWNS